MKSTNSLHVGERPERFWDRDQFQRCVGIDVLRRGSVGNRSLSDAIRDLSIYTLMDRVAKLEDQVNRRSVIVPIQALEPATLTVTQPIFSVVQEEDGMFVASFFDANINASGESQLDAVEMLKDMIVSTFRLLIKREAVLGEGPQQQLAVLRQFVRA